MADKQNRTLSGSFHTHTPSLSGNIPIFQGANGAVLYIAQNLTEAQKAQARENIGVVGTGESPRIELSGFSESYGSGVQVTVYNVDGGGAIAHIYDGKNGTSAFATVSKTDDVTTITTRDATGTKTAEVYDGKDGITPRIGENGNWFIGEVDTGVFAGGSSSGGIVVTGAKVGQTVKISAVDEKGVPTAWEAVEFPSEDEYELIETIVCDGTFGKISRTKLSLKKAKIVLNMKVASAAASVCGEAYNDAGLFGYAWIGNCINTGERFSTAWFVSDGVNAYTEYVLPGTSKHGSAAVNKTAYPQNADTPINKLSIYASPNSNAFPADSTIEIWGVRV